MNAQRLSRIGFGATVALMILLGLANALEAERQSEARAAQATAALAEGMDLYAQHCAQCHGSRGQGEIQGDAQRLDDAYTRQRGYDWLYKVIARGRHDTDMEAFSLDEGGALNGQQIDSLVKLILYGSWEQTAQRTAQLGLIAPEELALLTVTPTLVATPAGTAVANALPVILVLPTATPTPSGPSPEQVNQGLYMTYCAACHGGAGEGTADGPALTTPQVRQMSRSALSRVSFDNDEIEGHDVFLSPDDKRAILAWVETLLAAVPAGPSPEELNRAVYLAYCGSCHGGAGEGTADGPALTTPEVLQMSRSEFSRISFDNDEIEGHDTFLSPDEKRAILAWREQAGSAP